MKKEWKEAIVRMLIGLLVVNIAFGLYYVIWIRSPFVVIIFIIINIILNVAIVITGIISKYFNE